MSKHMSKRSYGGGMLYECKPSPPMVTMDHKGNCWAAQDQASSYGLYSYGLYSYGLYSYGCYSYGRYSYGHTCSTSDANNSVVKLMLRPDSTTYWLNCMTYTLMAYIGMTYLVMAYIVMACLCTRRAGWSGEGRAAAARVYEATGRAGTACHSTCLCSYGRYSYGLYLYSGLESTKQQAVQVLRKRMWL